MPLRARIFDSCVYCVFCDKLIIHAEESDLVRLSNCVWFRNVNNAAVWAHFGLLRHRETTSSKALRQNRLYKCW